MSDAPLDLADLPSTWAQGQHATFLQRYPAGRRVVVRVEVAGPPGRDGTPLLVLTREGDHDLEMLWLVDAASDPPRVQMRRSNATRGGKKEDAAAEHVKLVDALLRDALAAGRLSSALPLVACDAKRFGVAQAIAHEAPAPGGRVRYLLSPRCAVLGVLQTQAFADGEVSEPGASEPPKTATGHVVAGLQLLSQAWGERPGSVLALDDLRRVDLGGVTLETPRAWLPRRRGVEIPGRFAPLYTAAWFLKEGGPGQALEGSLAQYTGEARDVDARAAYIAEQDAETAKKRGARSLERKEVPAAKTHHGSITGYRAKDGALHVEALLVRADHRVLVDLKLDLSVEPGAADVEKTFSKVATRLVDTVRFASA